MKIRRSKISRLGFLFFSGVKYSRYKIGCMDAQVMRTELSLDREISALEIHLLSDLFNFWVYLCPFCQLAVQCM